MQVAEFHLFPAIDILDGRCVRLLKGDYNQQTEYGDNPAAMAERWIQEGARWLHVVDLDAAKVGKPVNTAAISEVVRVARAAGVAVQVGGGIRDLDTLRRWLDLGVHRCVVGTAARQPDWVNQVVSSVGHDALVVGLDGRQGKLAVNGWLDQTEIPLVKLAEQLAAAGARHALVTDVDRDGTLQGANLVLTQAVQAAGLLSIASGGIRNLADVLAAKAAGLAGAIAGRAIYDGRLSVREAIAALEEGQAC
ncbi:1-(5-phosphoribosyl)-5-[(5-phosphoribosylamino) methylideneamino] imidazole-4-carboxamide isomerase [Alicyclobacillus contaminans]|uniref:1-(5-phosphoribosyl)-5-[(5- phosphoribosylamino)methylideneamino]imidazole-4- carboxamide isomerase n=1 Tax=Alicyclobacillus contaminans TaxID=392016 RepID=UPI0003F60DD1|nr:1-(5-phosphoribosyl)-5-[(5-phosphoribosylamino)methylideneamino]imidazole-4-carboxamide isomerase [Alicyclobacillus contaminans]GMA49661.1 1-(5-phosphoribosyl)-5-[(5-phosphoribosylamino) methylideneamino] imidazole-4-carboxamide isomerase [Alicyclobacillus contaminans]